MKNIKALLFDAGDTLIYPRSGHWFIPPKYENFFNGELLKTNSQEAINRAYQKASQYLCDNHLIKTEEEEYEQFIEFYRIWLSELKTDKKNNDFYAELSADNTFNNKKFVLYEDVIEYLKLFSQKYKLGIISDTWPSLKRVFKVFGIYDYFSIFVISSIIGVCKPDPGIYISALKDVKVKAKEILFIDNSEDNLDGAVKTGMKGICINRKNSMKASRKYETIFTLMDLDHLLASFLYESR